MSPSENLPSSSTLDWLFARQRFGIHPGLVRVQSLLKKLGLPQRDFEVVLVGGTNGKGSTAATLAAIMQANGQRVGLFTSPHLTRFSERFVVDGQELAEEVVSAALSRVKPAAEATETSFFEIVTALACVLFAEAGVQVAVMEVGMGGRLDATNALEPQLSIITNVSLDHTHILGSTETAIAKEKAGILRAGKPGVTAVSQDLLPILEQEQADLWALDRDFTLQSTSLGWEGSTIEVPELTLSFTTPLLGEHGARNATLAAVAAQRLGVSSQAIAKGTRQTRWPGRLEVLPNGNGKIVIDGAHNPAGARALVQALTDLRVERLPLIFGAAEDKDVRAIAQILAPFASRVILTRATLSPRAAMPEVLAQFFPDVPVTLTYSPGEALQAVEGEPLALACGSLYMLGELRPLLLGEQVEVQERWQ